MNSLRRAVTASSVLWAMMSVTCAVVFAAQALAEESTVREQPPVAQGEIPDAIARAINAPDRPASDKALDAGRRPEQTLSFFGIKPGMKVADLFAGAGYTTELLSRIVGPTGKVYSQNPKFTGRLAWLNDAWANRFKEPALSNVVRVPREFSSDELLPVAPNSLDAVIINLNYHDLVRMGLDRDKINRQVYRALKPSGLYCVVDHSAQNGSGARDAGTLHRIDESVVTSEVERAGFKLAGASGALRHPEDDRTWSVFKHRGATDRFVLKFTKS